MGRRQKNDGGALKRLFEAVAYSWRSPPHIGALIGVAIVVVFCSLVPAATHTCNAGPFKSRQHCHSHVLGYSLLGLYVLKVLCLGRHRRWLALPNLRGYQPFAMLAQVDIEGHRFDARKMPLGAERPGEVR
jgi:hypothetical protein